MYFSTLATLRSACAAATAAGSPSCVARATRARMVWSVLDGHLLSRRAEATPTNKQALYVGYEAANTRLTCSLDRKPRDIQHRLAGGDHGGQLPAEFFAVAPEVAPAG